MTIHNVIQKLGNGEGGPPDFLAGASDHRQRLRKHGENPEDFRNAEQVSKGELVGTQQRQKIWSKAESFYKNAYNNTSRNDPYFKNTKETRTARTESNYEQELIDLVRNSIYYHGTSKENASLIRSEGLIPSTRSNGCAKLLNTIGRVDNASSRYVYVTRNPKEAAMYAKMHNEAQKRERDTQISKIKKVDSSSSLDSFETGTIVSMVIPPTIRMEKDPEAANGDTFETQAYRTSRSIDSSMILPRKSKDYTDAKIKTIVKTVFKYERELSKQSLKELSKILSATRPSQTEELIDNAEDFIGAEQQASNKLIKKLSASGLQMPKCGEELILSAEELENLLGAYTAST